MIDKLEPPFSHMFNQNGPIYLDYQATTPTDPRVFELMAPYFCQKFGNPHSSVHSVGWAAEDAIELSREKISDLVKASPKEIIFTSGATESNNLAIKGVAGFKSRNGNHIITSKIEHKCVLEACRRLERDGITVTYLDVLASGELDINSFKAAIKKDTFLVSIMGVNNETGVIQPIEEIGKICAEKQIFFHSDCSQAFGKIPIDVDKLGLDLMSISGHKIYGPMGIGALYVRRRPRVKIASIFDGGGQEQGLRSGTLPLPLCVGIGEAARIAGNEMNEETARLAFLREEFLKIIWSEFPNMCVNGSLDNRIYGNLNLFFPNINAEGLLTQLSGVAISTGSACSVGSNEPSYVLKAMGLKYDEIVSSVRIGFGRFTAISDVEHAARLIVKGIHKYRNNVSFNNEKENKKIIA